MTRERMSCDVQGKGCHVTRERVSCDTRERMSCDEGENVM